ncbi:MAG: hypothetical protein MUC66_08880, partial [Methanolinea sp.]|nr:hypothetical protein [Methanolinea sp.]
MKKTAIVLFALAILIVGTAMAVDPIPATTETQGISTTTGLVCLGTTTNTESVVWTGSNMDVRNNPPLGQSFFGIPLSNFLWLDLYIGGNELTLLSPERQSVMSYTESILADNGYSEFNEMQSLDTGNKVANQKNFA